MKLRTGHSVGWLLGSLLLLTSGAGLAQDGLQAPSADAVWPRFQARIALPVGSTGWLRPTPLLSTTVMPSATGGASVLGDYYFANHGVSHFRASGGLMLGAGSSRSLTAPASGGGLALRKPASGNDGGGSNDLASAAPYLGLGYSGQLWRSGIALSADFGLVAERTVISGSGARALFGNQALDGATRELRLSPLLQVGVRYTF